MQCSLRMEKPKHAMWLFGYIMLFKLAMEYAYVHYVTYAEPQHYAMHLNPLKYLYGFFWLFVLFFLIRHGERKASSFFLQFILVFQLVPITIIYEMKDENTAYYSVVCLSLAVCEWIVLYLESIKIHLYVRKLNQEKMVWIVLVLLPVLFLIYIYRMNGLPTTIALNVYDVYKLRRSGIYQLGKYATYLQPIILKTVIPILLTKFILQERYLLAGIIYGIEFLFYLYSGHKLYLFLGLLTVGIVFFAKRVDFETLFWKLFCCSSAILCFLVDVDICRTLYRFFLLRLQLLTSAISFYYFEFFTTHFQQGLAGIFPRWIFPIESVYGHGNHDAIPQLIGQIYFNNPQTWANNGMISEGYTRFGFIGILLEMIIFALILKLIDGFQEKTDYAFTLGCCVVIIFGLGDGILLGPIFFGHIGAWLLFMMFYRHRTLIRGCDTIKIKWERYIPRLVLRRRG